MNYIVFDLEATCCENRCGKPNEIIEIGAVKLNDRLEQIGEFEMFVRPTINPVLSDFCIKLTTITQKNVESSLTFEEAIKEFEDWIGDDAVLCSWGFYDRKQIMSECKLKSYSGNICWMLDSHISIKHQFAEIKGIKPCGMSYALEYLGLNLEGTHHRGIDDARNISKIFKIVFNELKFY